MAEKEYIEREAVKNKFSDLLPIGRSIRQSIDEIHTADVEEVRHGEWLPYFNEYKGFVTSYHCSLCGRREIEKEPYCHCGAKMDGGTNE